MIIHTPTKTIKDGQVYIASRFELETSLPYLPDELWYRFPERYANDISLRADAFAPTALLVAMYTGENLLVRGVISPRLAYSLLEYRTIYHSWQPDLFKKVDIKYELLEQPSPPQGNTAVATAFSGGVDSFYTLWAHRPENQPIVEAQITHGLFVHGLDLRIADEANYNIAAQAYGKLFEELGLELIQAATNAYQFSEFRINWTMFHGAPLIGAAMCLHPLIRQFYVPSSFSDYNDLIPYGSTPLIDHLLSTESTNIVHHGTSISRIEKTTILTEWSTTFHKLRVCANKVRMNGLNNCGTCHKCYRMITLLGLLDALPNYSNFPQKMTLASYLHWGLLNTLDPLTAKELRNKAASSGKIRVAFGIQLALIIDFCVDHIIAVFKKFLSEEHLYQLKRKIYTPEANVLEKEE